MASKQKNPVGRSLSKLKKCAFAAMTCVLLFAGLELVLAGCGVQPLYLSGDPYVGFQQGIPLFVRDGEVWKTNPAKRLYFNDQTFPVTKAPNTYRIFCLGGSTTFGHPYHDSTSYCGWLRELLRESDSQRDWQVVNCGGVSYASYRECLLMQELVRYQPDLFVVLSGHNEFLEDRTYAGLRDRTPVRSMLDFVVSRSRVGAVATQLIGRRNAPSRECTRLAAEVDTILEHSIGPRDYHRDARHRAGVERHFQHSLTRMCDLASAAGARVIFISPASNLRDFSPFKSEHGDRIRQVEWNRHVSGARDAERRGDSEGLVRHRLSAADIDPQNAQGLWDAARALFAANRKDEARDFFLRSVDEDICPLRASRQLQGIVKFVAGTRGASLVDFPRMLEEDVEQSLGHRIPGDESFLDHVHPTIDVHRQLAWAIIDELTHRQLLASPSNREEIMQQVADRVMSQIDSRAHALALIQVIQVLSWAGKNEEALALTVRAEETHPGLSEVSSYRGRLLEKLGREDEAFECFQEAVSRNPDDSLALYRLAYGQARRRDFEAASANFEKSAQRTPEAAPASFRANLRAGLGKCYLELGQWDAAISQLEMSLKLAPGDTSIEQLIRTARMKGRAN